MTITPVGCAFLIMVYSQKSLKFIKVFWSLYGFRTKESGQAGFSKAVGHFPFDTRIIASETAYCGLGPSSFIPTASYFERMSTRD
jgi:hypothetical protein